MRTELPVLKAADFASDQDVRWCPGCGDYSILSQMKKMMPSLGVPREKIVFISGIGCASRFPYYMNTYGIHSRPDGLGDYRGRRWLKHRRESLDARDSSQSGHQYHSL